MSNLFDSRKVYFDGLGNKISGCQKTKTALELSGLDYKVEKRPIFLENGVEIPDKYATVRNDTNLVLGVVGKDYCVLDNEEGFEFIDDIIGEGGVDFETAGSWDKGKRAFMVAKTEPINILGDEFAPYILFTNSHDGSGSIKAMFTPVRVVCNNALVLAEEKAQIKISVRHSKNAKDRLKIAKEVLLANSNYLENLKKNAELMNSVSLPKEEFSAVVREMAGLDNDKLTNIKRERAEQMLAEICARYDAPDLLKFNENVWRAVQCISDYDCHRMTLRDTNNPEIQLNRVMSGMMLLNTFIQLITKRKNIRLYK